MYIVQYYPWVNHVYIWIQTQTTPLLSYSFVSVVFDFILVINSFTRPYYSVTYKYPYNSRDEYTKILGLQHYHIATDMKRNICWFVYHGQVENWINFHKTIFSFVSVIFLNHIGDETKATSRMTLSHSSFDSKENVSCHHKLVYKGNV